MSLLRYLLINSRVIVKLAILLDNQATMATGEQTSALACQTVSQSFNQSVGRYVCPLSFSLSDDLAISCKRIKCYCLGIQVLSHIRRLVPKKAWLMQGSALCIRTHIVIKLSALTSQVVSFATVFLECHATKLWGERCEGDYQPSRHPIFSTSNGSQIITAWGVKTNCTNNIKTDTKKLKTTDHLAKNRETFAPDQDSVATLGFPSINTWSHIGTYNDLMNIRHKKSKPNIHIKRRQGKKNFRITSERLILLMQLITNSNLTVHFAPQTHLQPSAPCRQNSNLR